MLATNANDPEDVPGIALVLHDITELHRLENMRRDFVANVSHELKTPLSSIMAYAETLRLGAIRDESASLNFLEQIEGQAHLLNQQIQDLLQLARVESGEKTWEIAPVDLNVVCRQCVARFRPESEQQDIELALDLCDDNPTARGRLRRTRYDPG